MAVDAEQDSRARRDGIGDVADDLIGHGLSDLPVPAAPEHNNWTLSHVWPGTHTTAARTARAVIRGWSRRRGPAPAAPPAGRARARSPWLRPAVSRFGPHRRGIGRQRHGERVQQE